MTVGLSSLGGKELEKSPNGWKNTLGNELMTAHEVS